MRTWTGKGLQLPSFYCYKCQPKGNGLDEGGVELEPQAQGTTGVVRAVGITLLAPVRKAVDTFLERTGYITTPEELATADKLHHEVQQARKVWKLKMYGTKAAPGPIPAIRSGLDQLYALNREIDEPLGLLETTIERAMKGYHLRIEQERLDRERERQEAEDEAQREVERLAAKAQAAKPGSVAQVKALELLEQAEAEVVEAQMAVEEREQSEHTATKFKKVPTVSDVLAFCAAIGTGDIPADCIEVKGARLKAYYKEEPETVANFPGVTLIDDVEIIGR